MINITILSIIIAYICNKYIYTICDEIKKTNLNTIIVYTVTILSTNLIYYRYGITSESINYIALVPIIITISIIDYHTTYIYDITILNGIIIQGIIFIITIRFESDYMSHIVALGTGFLISYILAKTTKGLGEGDIGLFSLCCFTLGHSYSIYLIVISCIICSFYCVFLFIIKSDKIRKIPFAPFISLATILLMIINYDILNLILT